MDSAGISSTFSSFGPNSSGAVKPDASARGTASTTVNNNITTTVSGTSIATPIAAGGVACLIQAFPSMNRNTMRTQLRQTASLFPNHTDQMGYGILNFGSLYNSVLNTSELMKTENISIFTNTVQSILNIATEGEVLSLEVYDNLGRLVLKSKNQKSINVQDFSHGTYYLKIQVKDRVYYEKFLKD